MLSQPITFVIGNIGSSSNGRAVKLTTGATIVI